MKVQELCKVTPFLFVKIYRRFRASWWPRYFGKHL